MVYIRLKSSNSQCVTNKNKTMKEIVIRFGEVGQEVTITRVSIKDESNPSNKGKKLNQLEKIVLDSPVIISKPITITKETDEHSRKKPAKINATSRIIGVKILSKNFYEIESLNSVYHVRFH